MSYDIILFDADDTLFDFKSSEKEAFKNTILDFNIDYDENYHFNMYRQINSAIWLELENGLITQEKLKVERFKRFINALGASFNANEFSKTYMKHLANSSILLPDSYKVIEALYKKHRLFIITNGLSYVQHKRIKQSSIACYFENIIISEDVKISKPNVKIFEYALPNIHKLDKSKILMVGDSLSSDIQGGINCGIHTCWFNPHSLKNSTTLQPTYEITSIKELLKWLS